MLIYVDKKKEKQKKIRKLLIILFCLFLLLINLWQFNLSLNSADKSLTDYTTITHLNSWYKNAGIVYLFSSNKNKNIAVLIPEKFNRENALSTALALSRLPQKKYTVHIAPHIKEKDDLEELSKIFLPQAKFDSTSASPNIIITNNIDDATAHITEYKLFPHTINYKHAEKIQDMPALKTFLQNVFPEPPLPQNILEQDSRNIQSFISSHKQTLKNLIFLGKEPQFTDQNLFLKNIRLCLKSKQNRFSCALDKTTSFKQNLIDAKAAFEDEDSITTAYLLTSDIEIAASPNLQLNEDEGLRFVYNNRHAILFPDDIKLLGTPLQALYTLKEKAGLNPLFETADMHFYKFKIKEIDNDKDL